MAAPNLEEIRRVLSAALPDAAALANLLQFGMKEPPNSIVNTASVAGMDAQLQQVLDWAIRQRKLEQLVAAAASRSDRLDLQELHQQITKHGIDAGAIGTAPKSLQVDRERFAILCNRNEQWTPINARAREPRSELVFIPGAEHQGHRYFARRIASLLEINPRSIVGIGPPANHEPQPTTANQMLELFARTVGVDSIGTEADLASRIADRLSYRWDDRPIVVVAFTLEALPEGVQQYYSRWLPTIANAMNRAGSSQKYMHYYQPVEWRVDSSSFGKALSGWFASGDDTEFDEDEGREALAAITRSVPEFVSSVKELDDITAEHLTQLCKDFQIADRHVPVLIEACRKKRRTQDKLDTVNQLMATFNPTNPVSLK
jgi:hypothetical protein